ncbi:MAG: hypothetical protein IIC89_02205 [Chloroflexi bacterium]|nr:hypothetical protein [Chloroflexota bacterium]
MAVTGFRMAENTDARDRWMSVALQEMIAWRLRRVDTIIAVPTARLALAAVGVLVAYLVRTVILASDLRHVGIVDIVTDDLFGYVGVGVGVFVAIGRLR